MSGRYQNKPGVEPHPKHSPVSPPAGGGASGRRPPPPGPKPQVYRGASMINNGLPTPSSHATTASWQNQEFEQSLSSPILQLSAAQMATEESTNSLSPQRTYDIHRKPISGSSTPSLHYRDASQPSPFTPQLAQPHHEHNQACPQCEQSIAARESMLDELMEAQEKLEERDTELALLREQLNRQLSGPRSPASPALSHEVERELRELRLKCDRLQDECKQKDEQLQRPQARAHDQVLHHPTTNHQLEAQLQKQSQQLFDWSNAYNSLKAEYEDLKHLSSLAEERRGSQSREQDQARQKLEDVEKMRDFFKDNSARVADENIKLGERLRFVQKQLYEKTAEFDR